MMAAPSSPLHRPKSRALSPHAAVNISSKLRHNSLLSEHEDMVLLREKLTRIAVDRHEDTKPLAGQEKERPRSSGATNEHFKVLQLLPPERPSTPPSSPQPRDVLRKQLRLKQHRRPRRSSWEEDGLEPIVSVDEVHITPMEDVEENSAVHSPPARGHKSSGRLSIPGHLRVFSVLNKYPEGLRKRKSVHVDATEDGEEDRTSLKKTSSQINILAPPSGKLSRNGSGGDLFQTFAARQRREQDQEMEDAQTSLFGNKHGQLSACS